MVAEARDLRNHTLADLVSRRGALRVQLEELRGGKDSLLSVIESVARAVDAENWRRVLAQVRATAVGLARQGRVVITRHGKPADPDGFKGVYRLRGISTPST